MHVINIYSQEVRVIQEMVTAPFREIIYIFA
jgi:hypothetical protein